MNRTLALIGALLLSFLSIAAACAAVPPQWIRFTLESRHGGGRIEASFRSDDGARYRNNWSSGFRPPELVGLDLAGFRAAGAHPLRFSVIREAGRLDCSGTGSSSSAAGGCGLTPDPGFVRLIESRGIARPTPEQQFGLVALNVRRELIDSLAAAHYPTPTIDNLMGLTALGVDGAYIAGMARAGYRPPTLDALLQFKALDITPEWIAGFVRVGYADLSGDKLAQLKALNVTPDYIAGFDRLGYRHLPVDKLVQLKALDITPEFVRSAAGDSRPDVSKLVELKIFGQRR